MNIELDASKVSHGIYIQYVRSEGPKRYSTHFIKIMCNWCSTVFFEGQQEHASDLGGTWLVNATTHLNAEHRLELGIE